MYFRTRTLSPKRLIGVAVLAGTAALALVHVAAFAATSAAAARPAATPACQTSGLDIWAYPNYGGGYTGGYDYTVYLTNLSGHTCTLAGHAGISAVSLSGAQIGSPAGWTGPAPTQVKLANGATATVSLNIADPGNFGTQCFLPGTIGPGHRGVLPIAAGLRVYPPGQFTSKVAPVAFDACHRTGVIWMHAGPVQVNH